MKANMTYSKKKSLYMTSNYSVPSDKCTELQVTFKVDGKHIVLAIYDLLDTYFSEEEQKILVKESKITKKMVVDKIKDNLKYRGDTWVEDISENIITSENEEEIMMIAVGIAEDLYPEFMGVCNAEKFIKNIK
jgi:hypothetical protein